MSSAQAPETPLAFPFTGIQPGMYGYSRPGWSKPSRVEIYVSENYLQGETLVRFVKGFYGSRLSDLPEDAYFVPASESDTPMR